MNKNSGPADLPLPQAPPSRFHTKKPAQAPQPVIKKPQAPSRRRQSSEFNTILSTRKQALELENRLECSLAVAAGGITSLTKNIVARQMNPELVKDSQLTLYITRLRMVSEELKSQLKNMGECSKLLSQQDHKSFDSSYQRTVALWREYQRVSGCVVHHARIWRESRKESASDETDDSSRSSTQSSSSAESLQRMEDDSGTQRYDSSS